MEDFPSLADYEVISKIGHGGFGSVYKARDRRNNSIVAIKRILLHPGPGEALNAIPAFAQREIDVGLSFARNPSAHICRLIEHRHFPERQELFLVFEYYPFDVAALVPAGRADAAHIAFGILNGLAALHARGLIHRDVKPENVLVGVDGSVVLADFGLAREARGAKTAGVGTHFYRAPEQLLGATDYTAAVDVWALGCVLYFVAMGEDLFTKRAEAQLFAEMCEAIGAPSAAEWPEMRRLPNAPMFLPRQRKERRAKDELRARMGPNADTDYIDLIARMLEWSPAARITAEEALRHRAFREIAPRWAPPPKPEQHQSRRAEWGGVKELEKGLDIDASLGRYVPFAVPADGIE
jgi:serine/threonine protein kinase